MEKWPRRQRRITPPPDVYRAFEDSPHLKVYTIPSGEYLCLQHTPDTTSEVLTHFVHMIEDDIERKRILDAYHAIPDRLIGGDADSVHEGEAESIARRTDTVEGVRIAMGACPIPDAELCIIDSNMLFNVYSTSLPRMEMQVLVESSA